MSNPTIKVGDVFTTNKCGDCVVVEYINNKKVRVKFITTGYETWRTVKNLRDGVVKDMYHPSVSGVGYIGDGRYITNFKGEYTKEYTIWSSMLNRCYNVKYRDYHRYGGRGIAVCKEWHNFQNFAQWCNEQPNFGKEGFQLDKDLKIKGSKEYSPNTCSFVPQNVNMLLVACNSIRGEYPIGVCYNKDMKKYQAYCNNGKGISVDLGYYQTPKQAFLVYKRYKEMLIKEIAVVSYYEGNIIEEVYNNLMKYEVVPYPE